MGKIIAGHKFERVSDDEYVITYPDGRVVRKYYLAAENLMKQLEKQGKERKIETNAELVPKLEAFASTLNAFQSKLIFSVEQCYKDANAGTTWITIVARRVEDNMSYMFLSPIEQETLVNASYTEFSKLVSHKLSEIKKGGK